MRTLPADNGLIAAAKERNIAILAYSPLGQGRLSRSLCSVLQLFANLNAAGKYSAANPPSTKRYFSRIPMEEIEPLLIVMREIAANHSKHVEYVSDSG